MNGHEAAALYAAAFTPQHKELLRSLPEASEAFAAMLVELAKDPMLDRIDRCLLLAQGIRQHLHRIHAAAQGEGNGR